MARAETTARPEPQSLIAGALPSRSQGVKNPNRLTDGLYSNEGDEWLTDVTSRFLSARSFVEYDLGSARTIRCALTQADNNDVYILSGSQDGEKWQPLWRVGPSRTLACDCATEAEASARYVRLSATGGDALYSVGEIALYSECPSIWAAQLVRTRGVAVADTVVTKVVFFAIFAAFFLLVHRRKAARIHYLLILRRLPRLDAGGRVAHLYPLSIKSRRCAPCSPCWLGCWRSRRLSSRRRPRPSQSGAGTLVFCAVAAFATYWHFGTLQVLRRCQGPQHSVNTAAMRDDFPDGEIFPRAAL